MVGASMRQGPHQGAHMSTSTGTGERSTSVANVASVTSTGPAWPSSGLLQRPHTGASPRCIRCGSTRFFAPQKGQTMICAVAIVSYRHLNCSKLRTIVFCATSQGTGMLNRYQRTGQSSKLEYAPFDVVVPADQRFV